MSSYCSIAIRAKKRAINLAHVGRFLKISALEAGKGLVG